MRVRDNCKNIIYVFALCARYMKAAMLFNAIYIILSGIAPIIVLQMTKYIMDIVELKVDGYLNNLIMLGMLILGIHAIQTVFVYINNGVSYLNNLIFGNKFDRQIFNKLKELDISYYDSLAFNELLSKVYSGSNTNCFVLITYIFEILQSSIVTMSFVVSLFVSNIQAVKKLIILTSSLIGLIYRRYFFHRQNQLTESSFEKRNLYERKSSLFNNIFFESSVQDELKTYNSQEFFMKMIRAMTKKVYQIKKDADYKIHNYNRIGAIGVFIIQRVVYITLLYDIYTKQISYGEFVLIVGILEGLFSEVVSLNANFSSLWEGLFFINYVREFLNLENKIQEVMNKSVQKLEHVECIEFRNVYFRYKGMEQYVLKDVSFKIYKGQKIGIIGINGSGKSTILKLLMRLYDVDKGMILINNRDIKEYEPISLYKKFSVIFQDFCKYSLSVQEFITFNNLSDETNFSKVEEALRSVGMYDAVQSFPNGVNTLLTKNFSGETIELSTGQWQKLSLARACYMNREVMILDEPSAALDVISERAIFDSLKEKFADKTIITVSHNLSVTNACDNIILLDEGLVKAEGTHNKLIETSVLYRNLYNSQAERFAH